MGENEVHEHLCHRGPDYLTGKNVELVLSRGCHRINVKFKICVKKNQEEVEIKEH
jgi:hypothetical protein